MFLVVEHRASALEVSDRICIPRNGLDRPSEELLSSDQPVAWYPR